MTDSPHVLIVDDDTTLLQALPRTLNLRLRDVQVDTSDSALAALDRLETCEYDAIVSDIKMPGMDGLALLAKVQELCPLTPILLITGHGEYDLTVQALRGGAYDFIQKPIDRDYFTIALRRAIHTYQLRRQIKEQQLALELHARSLERLVQKRTSELVEANAAKDKFLGIVSHELKTPLTSLKGMSQLLQRQLEAGLSAEVVKRGLVDMERAITRTDVLVQDLLDASLIQTNMFVLHRTRCDLVELCRNLLTEYTAGAGPDLSFDFLGQPIEVEVDCDRIGQVLINLLSNARKYSPKGTPITLTLQQSGYEAVISVRDMGIGIPADELPHIFDEFYRAPTAEVQNGTRSGLGLGLYIARKIVERHGGHIDVQSFPGEGSVFSVVLPLYLDIATEYTDMTTLTPHTQAVWTMAH